MSALTTRPWTPARLSLALLVSLGSPALTAADDWVEITSPNFRVITDQDDDHARRVALDLERIHRLYEQVLPGAVSDPFRPVLAVVVEDDDALVEWLPQYKDGQRPGGVFFSGRSGHYMVIRLDAGRQTVYHEYLHLLTRLNVGGIPIWLNEGLAEFYSATDFVGSKAKFGRIDQQALSYLRSRSLIPLEELVGRTTNPHQDGNWIDIRVFYAQAWALTHYLMLGNETLASTGAVSRYMSLVQQGADQTEAFVEVVGPLDDVREDLRRYTRNLLFRIYELELGDDLDDDGYGQRDLPYDELIAEQAVVLAGAGYVDEGDALLTEATVDAPPSPALLTATGLVALHRNDPATAAAAFSAAVASGATSYLPYYWSVTANRSMDPDAALEPSERIRRLRRAVALNPRFVPAYQELSRLLLADEQLGEGFEVARQAVELDSRDTYSWRLLGQAALRSEEIDAARLAGQRGVASARDDRAREMMESFLAEVDRYEEYVRRRDEQRRAAVDAPVSASATRDSTPSPRRDRSSAREAPAATASGDPGQRQVTMAGTWIELRCDSRRIDFVIQSHRPPTTLVVTAAGGPPVEIMGPSGEVQERIPCGPVNREVEVDLTIRRIDSGTVYGDLTELRFP